jgi:hypothetical protein
MVYRKDELTRHQINKGWPHQVAVVVPGKGLGRLLNEMHEFCRGRDHKPSSELRLGGSDLALWCFAHPDDAEAFRDRFQDQAEIVPAPPAAPKTARRA